MVNVATAPLAFTLTPGPVKFKAVAFLTNIVPLLKTSIQFGTAGGITLLPTVALALPVIGTTGITGTKGVVFAPGVCPDPGPGDTVGGTTSGGPGRGQTTGTCPVPGPGGTPPGRLTGGPDIILVDGIVTGVGPGMIFVS